MKALYSTGLFIARLLLAAIFIVSGVMKIQNFSATEALLASKAIPVPQIVLAIVIAIEILGGIFLVLGLKARFWATILFLYLIPVTLLMHNFWEAVEADKVNQLFNFLKNLGIMGGLLYVITCGPGGCSCDRFSGCRKEVPPANEPPSKV